MVVASMLRISVIAIHLHANMSSDISGLLGVPELKQPKQRPLNAANSVLLVLLGIFTPNVL